MDIVERFISLNEIDGVFVRTKLQPSDSECALLLKAFSHESEKQIEEIMSALAARDWPRYCVTVHGIKSSLRTIGAAALGEFAYRLELASKDGGDVAVCVAETDDFAGKVTKFSEKIMSILSEYSSNSEEKEQIDMPALKDLLARLLKACNEFNLTAADELLTELKKITTNSALDEKLDEIAEKVEMIEYSEAATAIKNLKEEGVF